MSESGCRLLVIGPRSDSPEVLSSDQLVDSSVGAPDDLYLGFSVLECEPCRTKDVCCEQSFLAGN